MVQGHSRFQKQAWCWGTPGSHNGASERSELAPLWEPELPQHRACFWNLDCPSTIPGFSGLVLGHAPARSGLLPVPGGLEGLAPGPKCQKVDRFLENPHEMSIRSMKKADFLRFGYSIERRIDLEGSRCGLEAPISNKMGLGAGWCWCWGSPGDPKTGRCWASPVIRGNPQFLVDGDWAPWATLVLGQSRLLTAGCPYIHCSNFSSRSKQVSEEKS